MVAIPELDGATGPMVFGGRSDGAHIACTGCHAARFRTNRARDMHACTRARRHAGGARRKLVALRRTERAERKVASCCSTSRPTPATPAPRPICRCSSRCINTLGAMKREPATVEVPAERRRAARAHHRRQRRALRRDANVHARIRPTTMCGANLAARDRGAMGPGARRSRATGARSSCSASASATSSSASSPLRLRRRPDAAAVRKGFAPTHAFSRSIAGCARISAPTPCCISAPTARWNSCPASRPACPALLAGPLIGDLPNFYLYASNNPSEGTIAKRRAGATLISYLTPPVAHAGLYRGLLDLKASLERWRGLAAGRAASARGAGALIQAQAARWIWPQAEPAWAARAARRSTALSPRVLELEYTLIPHGLHVVGEAPRRERVDMLQRGGRCLACDLAAAIEALVAAARGASAGAHAGCARDCARARLRRALLAQDHEIRHAARARRRFVRPAPGGDLLRTPAILPTGRNLHGFDPFRIPSAFAVQDGARQAAAAARAHAGEGHALPETVAMVLWGTDNLKTEGGPIAQALALMGARAALRQLRPAGRRELIPLAEARPAAHRRGDHAVGHFRDLLPLQIKLLAEAAFLAASADEPPEQNFVRKHALAYQAEHGGCDLETRRCACSATPTAPTAPTSTT
jgi:magnesium chelatase subunit H